MTSLRSLTSALLATALLALAGCGGGGGDAAPTPVQVDTTRTASVTLGPAGGTVVATAADGRRYTLTVEPGALATATEITATPVVSMGSAPLAAGLKGAVRFGPAGLRFALPATLRIEGANPATSEGSKLVGFLRSADGASMQLVPTTVAAAGAIVMRVRHFTDVGASQATAQEVAQVPIDPSVDPVDALALEYIVSVSTNQNAADTIALLVRLHDTRVAPRLTVAELRTVATDTERGTAISVVSEWISLVNDEFAEVPGGLAPLVAAMRQRVAAIISEDFDIGLAACMGPAPIGSAQLAGLENALRTREQLRLFRDNGGLPGLDRATAARRVNDCVRIVFEPRPLPTFEIGRPVSLDFRARLVFAADPNASIDVPFDFDVSAPGSSGPVFGTDFTSFGFSDAQGNYTTVVTPRDAEPEFLAEACMVVSWRNGGPVGSLLCGQQTLTAGPNTMNGKRISAEYGNTCALTGAGGVKCWGENSEGQLGNGRFGFTRLVVDVVGLSNGVVSVGSGRIHNCALTSAGGVKCWGNNEFGQFGDGSRTSSAVPVNVSGLGSGVVALSVGADNACAVTSAGSLKCWGENSDGQLGNGSITPSRTGSTVPVDVIGLSSGVIAVSVGQRHACALTSAGGVKCWGDAFNGQLGNGIKGQPGFASPGSTVPVDVVGLGSGVVSISSDDRATCAITTAGGLKCWGANNEGQLGNGSTTDSAVPVDVTGLGSGVMAVEVGAVHTCAITRTAGIKCWGDNFLGQLGNGSRTNSLVPVDATGFSSGVVDLGVGINFTCALYSAGGIKCVGLLIYLPTPNGTSSDFSLVPLDVPGFP